MPIPRHSYTHMLASITIYPIKSFMKFIYKDDIVMSL